MLQTNEQFEARITTLETQMGEMRSTLLGTWKEPGAMELLRRTNADTQELSRKIDDLSANVNSSIGTFSEFRWRLIGIGMGLAGTIGLVVGIVVWGLNRYSGA
jgi:hypothetical protein